MSKVIKKYIQFAIDNGYITMLSGYSLEKVCKYGYYENTIHYEEGGVDTKMHILKDIITSKRFIEAVARGINPTMKNGSMGLNIEIDGITTKQAIAIRDNKLEEFINNLLPNE